MSFKKLISRIVSLLSIIVLFGIVSPVAASQLTVIYPKAQSELDPRQAYFIALLDLALECTRESYGEYKLELYDENLPPSRIPLLIKKNRLINIMSSPVTGYLNDSMRAIPFPLLRGIQGVRISLLHKDNQHVFSQISKVQDMQKLVFGFGLGWVDALIFQEAKLRVDTSVNYDSLFAMLSNKRIIAFPRGANEVLPELVRFQQVHSNLIVDQYAVIYYPLPVYFYVNKDNDILATRILEGLTCAANQGSFQQLFDQYYGDHLNQLNLENRKVFVLKNHHLPDDTEAQISNFLHPYIKRKIPPVENPQRRTPVLIK
ncbi:hypothetical protein [Aliiglaciecola litoralis]|uniref:Solute-binding protein family 3/N-terminal domain-containing protein n=1 Tax=Aliiglaciecola litoralis TaxID=582857 RepID=A0ABN1LE44_9ALTE